MRIAIVLTPISDHHLRLASQLGVSDVVIRFPGLEYSDLADLKTRIESFGLRVPVMEGYLPIEDIKLGGRPAGYRDRADEDPDPQHGASRDRAAVLQLHRRGRLGQDLGE